MNKKTMKLIMTTIKETIQRRMDIETASEAELNLVFFTYILGGWKAMVMSPQLSKTYFEVTYNATTDEIYVSMYGKATQINFDGKGEVLR